MWLLVLILMLLPLDVGGFYSNVCTLTYAYAYACARTDEQTHACTLTHTLPHLYKRTHTYSHIRPLAACTPVTRSCVHASVQTSSPKGLVDKIHAKGLKAGWYLNDCLSYCASLGDHCSAEECIPGDVKAFVAYGFDNLKVDG